MKKKNYKKDIFAAIASKLVDIGGGNKSNLNCAGFDNFNGAKQLENLTETLFECEMNINDSCNNDLNPILDQNIMKCQNTTDTFKKVAEECFEKTMIEDPMDFACSCWTGGEMSALSEEVTSCKFEGVLDNQQRLKSCISAFSKCKKAEDEAVTSMYICSKHMGDLAADIEDLRKNLQTLSEAKDKITKVIQSRPATFATCPEFVALVDQCKYIQLKKKHNSNLIFCSDKI